VKARGHWIRVITTGLARNYLVENLDDLQSRPAHLHVALSVPAATIRASWRR